MSICVQKGMIMSYADLVIKSDAIFTGLMDKPFPGGIAIKDNLIMAVEAGTGIDSMVGSNTRLLNYNEKLIMPGFIDSHVHFYMGANVASGKLCKEISQSTSESECINIVSGFAAKHTEQTRIIGMGWSPSKWSDSRLPRCRSLDAIIHDKPVYLLSADAHILWINTAALKESEITNAEMPAKSEIGKFDDGSLNGLLFGSKICKQIMDKLFKLSEDTMIQAYLDFCEQLNSRGITSVSDISAYRLNHSIFDRFQGIKKLEGEGKLTVRIHIFPKLDFNQNYDTLKVIQKEFYSEKAQISGLKHFLDGVTSTYTGFLLEPYTDCPTTKGTPLYPKEIYEKSIIQANKEGLGVRLHAIGDGAVRMALDLFEASNLTNNNLRNWKNIRNTIEHCETIHANDIGRFQELGVIASMQPYHLTLDANEKVVRMGLERCSGEWPHRSLLDRGAMMAFGTDYPVIDFNPFLGIYAAVARCDDEYMPTGVNPRERITLSEALKAYTYYGAYVNGREMELGTLAPGRLADLIVVNRNLFLIEESEIKDCSVELTVMDGNIVYEKEN